MPAVHVNKVWIELAERDLLQWTLLFFVARHNILRIFFVRPDKVSGEDVQLDLDHLVVVLTHTTSRSKHPTHILEFLWVLSKDFVYELESFFLWNSYLITILISYSGRQLYYLSIA